MLSWLHGSAHQSQKHDRGHGIEFGPEIKVQGMACKRKTPDCWSMSFPPLLISCRVCFPMPYTPSIHVSEIATIKPGQERIVTSTFSHLLYVSNSHLQSWRPTDLEMTFHRSYFPCMFSIDPVPGLLVRFPCNGLACSKADQQISSVCTSANLKSLLSFWSHSLLSSSIFTSLNSPHPPYFPNVCLSFRCFRRTQRPS